jgi:hypothetical protein
MLNKIKYRTSVKRIIVLLLVCVCFNCIKAQNTKINMRGFKCFVETDEVGSDEMYFIIQVFAKGVLVKTTRFPENGKEFGDIDKGEFTTFWPNRGNIYDGPIDDVQIVVYATESDKGSIADAFKSIVDIGATNLPAELYKYASPAFLASELKKAGNPIGGIYTKQYNRAIPLASKMTNEISTSFKTVAGKFYSPGDEPLESRVIVLNTTALLNDKMRIKSDLGNTPYNFDSEFIYGDGGSYKVYFDYVTIPPAPTPIQVTVVAKPANNIVETTSVNSASQSITNNVLFYNNVSGAATITNSKDFGTVSQFILGAWTHIVPMINNDILFYNSNSSANTITNNSNFSTSRFNSFSSGWTSILKLDNERMLFHNSANGQALITNNTDFKTLQNLDLSLYTHIANAATGKLIMYSSITGQCAVTDISNFQTIASSSTIIKGCTSIKYVGNNKVLFYNTTTGAANTYNTNDLTFIQSHPFSAGWTSIEKIAINKMLFYNANTGVGLATNATDFNTISELPFSSGWSHIVEIK